MTVTRRLTAAGAGLSVAATVLLTAPAAQADAVSYTTTTNSTKAAAGWLATQFVNGSHLPATDGDHFDSKYGSSYYPNYGENADVIFGLAAAKAASSKIDVALAYLAKKANVEAYADINGAQGGPYDGSIGKLAVAAQVAGKSATSVGGYNLLAQLKKDECAANSTTCTPGSAANIYSSISESFVILAEARDGKTYKPSTAARTYFESLQCGDGGFTAETAACGTGTPDVDSTSYAIMAMAATGGQQAQLERAVIWLKSQQNSKGYWVEQGIPNPNSTGLAAAALSSQGVDVSSARDWLRSQEVPRGKQGAGAIKYDGSVTATTTSATSPSVLATAQALTGLVDGGSLATLTARGASSAVPMYAPVAKLSSSHAKAGAKQSVTANGFVPGEKVHVVVHSTATTVATATAGALGAVKASYKLPGDLSAGSHSVVLTGATSGLRATDTLTITAAAASTSASSSAGATASATPTATTTTQSLAATGQNTRQLDEIAVLGGIAVLVGAGLLVAGRRRPAFGQALRAATGRHRTHR